MLTSRHLRKNTRSSNDVFLTAVQVNTLINHHFVPMDPWMKCFFLRNCHGWSGRMMISWCLLTKCLSLQRMSRGDFCWDCHCLVLSRHQLVAHSAKKQNNWIQRFILKMRAKRAYFLIWTFTYTRTGSDLVVYRRLHTHVALFLVLIWWNIDICIQYQFSVVWRSKVVNNAKQSEEEWV